MTSLKRRLLEMLPQPLHPPIHRVVQRLRSYVSSTSEQRRFELLHRREFFRRAFKALSFNGIEGDYAEFGSWLGMTFMLAFQESRRAGLSCKLWAFDSFAGLPHPRSPADEHPAWRPGAFGTTPAAFHEACRKHGIPPAEYDVVVGQYEDTLGPGFAGRLPTNICLAYLDCDLYSSAREVLGFLAPRLKHGMIIALDDYYCWSSTQPSGERRALAEVFQVQEEWRLVPYVQFGWHGMSFVVEQRAFFDARLVGF